MSSGFNRASKAGPSRSLGAYIVDLVPGFVHPNHVTLLRIALTAAMLAVYMAGGGLGLVVLFGFLAGLSDLLDGALARRRGLTSALGAFLDPLSDKIYALVLAVLVWLEGLAPLWLLLALLLTELHTVLIPLFVMIGRRARGEALWPPPKVQPNRWGKLKTGWVASSLGLGLIGLWLKLDWLSAFGAFNLWVALALGLIAEFYYFSAWRAGEFK